MKKLVIILLVVLPFVLIYFISITGRILEKYSHIYVESITLQDEEENEIKLNSVVEIEKNSSKKFIIVIGPELATNPEVKVSNINPEVCEYTLTDGTLELTGLKYGQTKFIITSIDRTNVTYTLNVKVTDDVPTALVFKDQVIKLMPGKQVQLPSPSFEPISTKPEYKGLVWESSDNEIVKIEDETSGLIKTLKEGTATITVKTTHKDISLSASITVVVSLDKSSLDVHFTHMSTSAYPINITEFDLKTITGFSDSFKEKYSESERYTQFGYKLLQIKPDINASKLSEGIIIIDSTKGIVSIKIGIYMISDPDTIIDEITIIYKK